MRPLESILPKKIPINQLIKKKKKDSILLPRSSGTCRLSQEAQLGSQDGLEGNHLRDLSVSLLSRTQFTMVS